MKKSTAITTGSITLAGLALLAAVSHADSRNHADINDLNVDMENAAQAVAMLDAGEIIEIELETDDAQAIWEVDLVNAQNQKVTVEIDGQTGAVLSTKTDNDDEAELNPIDSIELAKAIEIVKAVEQGVLIEAELEQEDGALFWEIESIGNNDKEKKFRVNAETGELLI